MLIYFYDRQVNTNDNVIWSLPLGDILKEVFTISLYVLCLCRLIMYRLWHF